MLAFPLITVPGIADTGFPLPIAGNPSFVGISWFFQWWIVDGAGPQGLAASDGLQITF